MSWSGVCRCVSSVCLGATVAVAVAATVGVGLARADGDPHCAPPNLPCVFDPALHFAADPVASPSVTSTTLPTANATPGLVENYDIDGLGFGAYRMKYNGNGATGKSGQALPVYTLNNLLSLFPVGWRVNGNAKVQSCPLEVARKNGTGLDENNNDACTQYFTAPPPIGAGLPYDPSLVGSVAAVPYTLLDGASGCVTNIAPHTWCDTLRNVALGHNTSAGSNIHVVDSAPAVGSRPAVPVGADQPVVLAVTGGLLNRFGSPIIYNFSTVDVERRYRLAVQSDPFPVEVDLPLGLGTTAVHIADFYEWLGYTCSGSSPIGFSPLATCDTVTEMSNEAPEHRQSAMALFRTPPTATPVTRFSDGQRLSPVAECVSSSTFEAVMTPYGQNDRGVLPAVTKNPSVGPLTDCNPALPFAPALGATFSTTRAGASPDLTVTVSRTANDAYLTGTAMKLPDGVWGSPDATPVKCDEARARSNSCPAASVVGSANMVANVFADRQVRLTAKVYNGEVLGSDIATFWVVAQLPPIARNGVLALPVHLSARLSGGRPVGIDALIDDFPTAFDVRTVSFTFAGAQTSNEGRPLLINGTACRPGDLKATLLSELGQRLDTSSPFSVTDCAETPFAPKLSISVSDSSPGAIPDVTTKVQQSPVDGRNQSNQSGLSLVMPPTIELNTPTLGSCSAEQAQANDCPESSRIGSAKAVSPLSVKPFEGSVYLTEMPAGSEPGVLAGLSIPLKGVVDFALFGTLSVGTDGVKTAAVADLPDTPISSFELTLSGGLTSGLLKLPAKCGIVDVVANFTSQSGQTATASAPIDVNGSGADCGVKSSVRLSDKKAGGHPDLSLAATPGTLTPMESFEMTLGSGRRSIRVKRSVGRSAGKAGRRPSVKVGAATFTEWPAGPSVVVPLTAGGGPTVSAQGSTDGAVVEIQGNKIVARGLPGSTLSRIQVRLGGAVKVKKKRRWFLTNPKKKGSVRFDGTFRTVGGEVYTASSAVKITAGKKRKKKRKRR